MMYVAPWAGSSYTSLYEGCDDDTQKDKALEKEEKIKSQRKVEEDLAAQEPLLESIIAWLEGAETGKELQQCQPQELEG